MEDYKNEQWWIQLQQSLNGFDDSKMSDSDLGRWNGAIIGGRRGGATNAKSGHMKKIQQKGAYLGGKAQGHITGTLYGKYNSEKLTFEQRSKGGITSGNNNKKNGHWDKYIKLGAEASTKARIQRAYNKKIEVLSYITTETFIAKDIQSICNKLNYVGDFWKKVLREKNLVEQIHKGYNQFNPSVYKKTLI
jgi:hypothetical protein